MKWLDLIERSPASVWLRESEAVYALPGMLWLHTVGMGLAVGMAVVIGLRWLGFMPELPLVALARFGRALRVGLWVSVPTGLALVLAYPTKAVTNPVFYAKLLLIGVALATWRASATRALSAGAVVPSPQLRRWVLLSLLAWSAALVCGRLLPYTYTRLMADWP